MRGLLRLGNQTPQVRLRAVAEVILFNRPVAEVEQTQAQAELAVHGPLHHAMPLQNHEKAVRRALVQLE